MSGSYYVDSSNRENVNELLDQAELYRDQALQYSNDAAASATYADSSEANALSIANNAAASASAASTSQANAAYSASAAASSAANASSFSSSASSFATDAGVARDAAVVAKNDAQTAATNAAASATQANDVLSSSLLKANNLSDLVNATTARSNLGLGTAATQTVTTSNTDTTAGRVLKIGHFGLGDVSGINAGGTTDLNTITRNGWYYSAGTAINTPSGTGAWGALFVVSSNNSFKTQIYYEHVPPFRTWQRTYYNATTWGAWQEVMTSTNVTTSSTDSTAGRLLKVGDFGLGSNCVIFSGNLNDLRTTGFFSGSGMANAPSTAYYYVRVMAYVDTDYCTQEATELTSTGPRVYIRSMVGGVWNSWREVSVGVSPKSACTAWVNFDGTGTVAIRDSYNVSSITDNGVGDYTINFATAMANTNYMLAGGGLDNDSGDLAVGRPAGGLKTNTAIRIKTVNGAVAFDSSDVGIIFFGGK